MRLDRASGAPRLLASVLPLATTVLQVITNNYRTYERGRRKQRACAVDGRARAARRTSCLSRLSESHAYVVVMESSGLIFINIIESGEGVVERDAARARGRVASTRCALRRPANRWSIRAWLIVKVTVETNSARMSEV